MGTATLFNMILTKHTIQLQDILTDQSPLTNLLQLIRLLLLLLNQPQQLSQHLLISQPLLTSQLQPMSQLQSTSQLQPIINLLTRHHLMMNQPNTTLNGKSLMTMQSLTTDKTKVEKDTPQVENTVSSSPI